MPIHPIEGLMRTAMESIRDMVDVNTILGDPVETPEGNVIIPISRVTFGFAAGGTEFEPMEDGGPATAGMQAGAGQGAGGAGGQGGQGAQGQGPGQGQQDGQQGNVGATRNYPFGGGSGAGISIQPVAFLVVGPGQLRMMPVDGTALYDRLIDMAPQVVDKIQNALQQRSRAGQGQTGAGQPAPTDGSEPAPSTGYRSPQTATLRVRRQTSGPA